MPHYIELTRFYLIVDIVRLVVLIVHFIAIVLMRSNKWFVYCYQWRMWQNDRFSFLIILIPLFAFLIFQLIFAKKFNFIFRNIPKYFCVFFLTIGKFLKKIVPWVVIFSDNFLSLLWGISIRKHFPLINPLTYF